MIARNRFRLLCGLIGALACLSASAGLPASVHAADNVFYYHGDALGSPVAMTNSSGTVVWQADYRPFGDLASLTENQPNSHRFTGKEFDPETGLQYFGARFYDEGLGRFVSGDPALLRGTPNLALTTTQLLNHYAYAANNPYRFVDPDGKFILVLIPGLIGALVAVTTSPSELEVSRSEGQELTVLAVQQAVGAGIGAFGTKFFLNRALGKGAGALARGADDAAAATGTVSGDWAKLAGTLRQASAGKGNFGIGSGARAEADALGKAWVGDGYKVASDGKTLISGDGLRQYRPPTFKPNEQRIQANFEQRSRSEGQWQSNAHLDIED